jgi:hypothetical protein
MIETAKDKAKKIAHRAVHAYAIATVVLIGFAYLGVQTGHLHAAVEVSGWQVGGGTEEHAAREQQLAALSAALPSAALTYTATATSEVPLPSRKPAIR